MLRLIATLRAHTDTRHAGILVLQTKADSDVAANALDLGADDLMSAGFDAAELALRLKALLRRKRIGEQLRATVRSGLRAAVNDPLTGLYNRRYAMPYLARMAERACEGGSVFAVMIADLDHFKRINDHFGHASGDAVLVEVADRLRQCLRTSDMIARIGGEEFLIVTPSTTLVEAQTAALRVCNAVSDSPIPLPAPHHSTKVTISIGMALGDFKAGDPLDPDTIAQELLHRADKALYAAKGRGRNQVKLGRPAA
jgi:two-component system cell cycle response regulator